LGTTAFPQLIAGPIVRYHDISQQISNRSHSFELFASGVQRFIYGLSKKMLIANPLGEVADSIFILSGNDLTMPLAWTGILVYTLQIFFDFSGYSDMAIGLGRMFGFRFHENFNYPYISTSVREFWRRWHISLSTWFRDYVYITLGGNRVSTIRIYMNLLLVFVLTGFWHGASWNFLVWGLFHGVFLASEHAGFSEILKKMWKPVQHAYVLIVVIIGWVFFRSDSFPLAISYLKSMTDFNNFQTTWLQFAQVLSYEAMYAFIIGAILSIPVYSRFKKYLEYLSGKSTTKVALLIDAPRLVLVSSLLFLSILKVASSTYNPFIYFRF
jgi:alginate O-acetyltransferase complex protein AlgI